MHTITVLPTQIIERHTAQDNAKVQALAADMIANGWTGRPLLAYQTDGTVALTGSHRIAAARLANKDLDWSDEIEIPVSVFDLEGINDEQVEAILSAMDDDALLAALDDAGLHHAAALMRCEDNLEGSK